MGRSAASAIEHWAAVQTSRTGAFHLKVSAAAGEGRESCAVAAAGQAAPGASALGKSAVGRVVGSEPQAGWVADEDRGH